MRTFWRMIGLPLSQDPDFNLEITPPRPHAPAPRMICDLCLTGTQKELRGRPHRIHCPHCGLDKLTNRRTPPVAT